jgi:hypothetical protein
MSEQSGPDADQDWRHKPRVKRSARPERIDLGEDVLIRNDVIAKEEGRSERDLNRGDKDGDPFTYVGNCKYRPQRGHREFMISKIRRLNPPRPVQRRRLRS